MNNNENKILTECWQNKIIDYENQKPTDKADTLRFCLSQISYLKNTESCFIEPESLHHEELETRRKYVDLMDNKNYVNNYADAILSLNKGFKNESTKWKCGLEASSLAKFIPNATETLDIRDEYGKLATLFRNSKTRTHKPTASNQTEKENCDDIVPDFDMFDDSHLFNDEFAASANVNSVQEMKSKSASMEIQRGMIRNSIFDMEEPEIVPRKPLPQGRFHSFPSQQNNQRSLFEFVSREEKQKVNKEKTKRYPWERLRANDEEEPPKLNAFKTASHQLEIDNLKKFGDGRGGAVKDLYGNQKRSLGARGIKSKFVPPVRRDDESGPSGNFNSESENGGRYAELMMDERLKNIDAKMVELIMNEIMDHGTPVSWEDIAGLELAKSTIQEIVVWPMLRPDIFTGLRGPPKGILLFGPPGTGKTMIGKCIACQSKSTFFSISASSLTSKWVGEGEKMVRAMFAVAKCHQPSVIFIDEIDSLLTQRSDTEHESSRRLKTEFLVQLDGATSGDDERILVVGATNRPQELDEAARRRLVKRLYIPLPDAVAREQIIKNLLMNQSHSMSEEDIKTISEKADGYSGADMANLCREAALGPIRSIKFTDIQHISVDQVRPITVEDFLAALRSIRASVSDQDLNLYEEWNRKYGINAR